VDSLRARIPLVVRCKSPIPADRIDADIGHSQVVLVHRSIGRERLGRLLDDLVEEGRRQRSYSPAFL
jgi:hypothetical protein